MDTTANYDRHIRAFDERWTGYSKLAEVMKEIRIRLRSTIIIDEGRKGSPYLCT